MPEQKCTCGGNFEWANGCGAKVCDQCGAHKGLCRCFCGWAEDGGNGRAQLEEMGEQIDAEGDFGGHSHRPNPDDVFLL